jgi:hypothetical protein
VIGLAVAHWSTQAKHRCRCFEGQPDHFHTVERRVSQKLVLDIRPQLRESNDQLAADAVAQAAASTRLANIEILGALGLALAVLWVALHPPV